MYAIRSYYASIELNSRIETQEAEGRFTVKHEAPLDVEAIKELRINGIVVPLNVITSYSIHYTKLYDCEYSFRCITLWYIRGV